MTEPMVDIADEQLPEAFFAWGGVRAVIPGPLSLALSFHLSFYLCVFSVERRVI